MAYVWDLSRQYSCKFKRTRVAKRHEFLRSALGGWILYGKQNLEGVHNWITWKFEKLC